MEKLYLLPLLLLLVLISCKEDGDTPTPDINETEAPCMVLEETRTSVRSGLGNRTATVEYDAKGQIEFVTYISGSEPELVDKFERNPAGKISKLQTFYGANVIWEMDFEYDSQGKWMKANTANKGGVSVLIEYEHDSQGNITKTTKTVEESGRSPETTVKTYEYTNGNLTRMILKRTDGGFNHYTYEYYLDKPAFPLEYDNIFTPTLDLGTPSKNLVKRVTMTWPNDDDFREVHDFTYKLNEEGMPIRTTRNVIVYDDGTINDLSPDSLITTRSYKCE